MTKYQLLPCPFCGQSAGLVSEDDHGDPVVVCDIDKGGCYAMGGRGQTEAEAVAHWNRRVSVSPPATQ